MDTDPFEPARESNCLLTFKEAAQALGIPYFKIQRAARLGLIPTYAILNSRKYVKVRDILERMSAAN